jgi:hypothetical protein
LTSGKDGGDEGMNIGVEEQAVTEVQDLRPVNEIGIDRNVDVTDQGDFQVQIRKSRNVDMEVGSTSGSWYEEDDEEG